MNFDLFSLFEGIPHVLKNITGHLTFPEQLRLAAASPVVARYLGDQRLVLRSRLLRAPLRDQLGISPRETTTSSLIFATPEDKFEVACQHIIDQDPDPWFQDNPEVAIVLALDSSEAFAFSRHLATLGVASQVFHGPLSSAATTRISQHAGLFVVIVYRLEGRFRFSYMPNFVALHPPSSPEEYQRQLRVGALYNITVTDTNPQEIEDAARLADFLLDHDHNVHPNREVVGRG